MQLADNRISAFSALVLFAVITWALPMFPGFTYDTNCWIGWTNYIVQKGVGNAYGSGSNYMPLYHYFLLAYGKIAGSTEAIKDHIAYLRCFTLAIEFWGLWMVYKWGNLKLSYTVLLLISIINISYGYNTVIWGQVDGIVAAFVFAMLYTAWKRNLLLSGIACILAVNMKLQAVIFIPIWGIMVLDVLASQGGLKKTGVMLAGMAAAQGVILLPYAMSQAGIGPIRTTVLNATETFPVVSMNAYNFWSWFVEEPLRTLDAEPATGNLTYKNAGLMLFFIGSFLAMLPLLKVLMRRLTNRTEEDNAVPFRKEQIWLAAALVGLLFFFFNTQMHERYSHPAFIFITAYAFSTRRFIPYILFSLAYFLNMEGVLQWFKLPGYDGFIFSQGFVALLFAATIGYLFVMLYRKEKSPVPVIVTAPAAKVQEGKAAKKMK